MEELHMAKKAKKAKKARKLSSSAAATTGLKLDFKLDKSKVEAIQNCLKKGKLTITVSKIDALGGRNANSYLYD
jgi:hypothetical protein